MGAIPYIKLLSRMSKEIHSNGDVLWSFNMDNLCSDLKSIKVDFISSSWNAAQRFYAYLQDFGLSNRL